MKRHLHSQWAWVLGGVLAPLTAILVPAHPAVAAFPEEEPDLLWPSAPPLQKVYDPGVGTYGSLTGPLYLNDHTFVRGPDGTWHIFGITGVEQLPWPNSDDEDQLAHATAPSLMGPWTKRADVLTNPQAYGESHVWAPHVTESGGTYYMFYAAGSGDHAAINYATSTDLYNWQRRGNAFIDGAEARDPYVTRIADRWVLYYTSTSTGAFGNYAVAYRTSTDLAHWSDRQIAYSDPMTGTVFENTESPFVFQKGDWWYLLVGPRTGYEGTDIYRSRDPFHFKIDDYAGHVVSHAAEIVQDGNDTWISGAGWYQRGVYLSRLNWSEVPPIWQSAQNPATARNADGRLEIFALEPGGNGIFHRWQTSPNGSWSDWENFGSAAGAVPTVGQNADGRLEVFALGPNGAYVAHRWQLQPSGGWSDWENFGGPAGAAPVVGQNADGRLEVFALGPSGTTIAHKSQLQPSGGWGDWENFGGATGAPPTVGRSADGRLEVFALGPGGANIAHRSQLAPSSSQWGDWDPGFGGPAAASPTVAQNADGRLELFILGPGGSHLEHRWQVAPNGGWSDWHDFGGIAGSLPAAGRNANGQLEVFVLGAGGGNIARRTQRGDGSWSDWDTAFGPTPAGCVPAIGQNADGRLEVFALGPEGRGLFHRFEVRAGGGWSDWGGFGDWGGGLPCGGPY